MERMRDCSLGLVGIVVLAGMLGGGCATNRGILDVRLAVPQNPAAGNAVTITRVTDCRVFEAAPSDASTPSLKAPDIADKTITVRAIARKRNGYGKAMGDIVLPPGRTVEDLVREALEKAFREAGYRVVDTAANPTEKAVPIEADIKQFWAWFTPGVWTISLQFEAQVQIKGDIAPFKGGDTVRGYVELHAQGAATKQWLNTVNKGIDAFVGEVKKRLAMK